MLGAFVLRAVYLRWLCPYDLVEDEAHYWLWSRFLDWSYYSKGPGVAWVIWLATRILGAVMALRLRDALPLTVYVWAFFPALVAMVAISGGQQMTFKHGAIGLVLLYAGVLALSIYAAWSFRRVARH